MRRLILMGAALSAVLTWTPDTRFAACVPPVPPVAPHAPAAPFPP